MIRGNGNFIRGIVHLEHCPIGKLFILELSVWEKSIENMSAGEMSVRNCPRNACSNSNKSNSTWK